MWVVDEHSHLKFRTWPDSVKFADPIYPSPSFSRLPPSRPANALRKIFFFELQAHWIVSRIREINQPVNYSEHKKNSGTVSNCHARTTPFNANKCRFADRCSLRHNRHGYTPSPTCILDVPA